MEKELIVASLVVTITVTGAVHPGDDPHQHHERKEGPGVSRDAAYYTSAQATDSARLAEYVKELGKVRVQGRPFHLA